MEAKKSHNLSPVNQRLRKANDVTVGVQGLKTNLANGGDPN